MKLLRSKNFAIFVFVINMSVTKYAELDTFQVGVGVIIGAIYASMRIYSEQ